MSRMGVGPLFGVLIVGGAPGCALLAGGFPDGRSGTLTTADGAPIAGADVIVESWTTGMRGQHLARKHTYATTTDADGRWRAASGVESGPEIGFDLLGYRLTLAWLGPVVGAPVGARRVVVGFGFGYF